MNPILIAAAAVVCSCLWTLALYLFHPFAMSALRSPSWWRV